jgi:hypothetical protein
MWRIACAPCPYARNRPRCVRACSVPPPAPWPGRRAAGRRASKRGQSWQAWWRLLMVGRWNVAIRLRRNCGRDGRRKPRALCSPWQLDYSAVHGRTHLQDLPAKLWQEAETAGRFDGAPVDLADGFIHFSTAEQAPETAAKHFSGAGRSAAGRRRDRQARRSPALGGLARRRAVPASLWRLHLSAVRWVRAAAARP